MKTRRDPDPEAARERPDVLEARLAEAEETLRAIRSGEVDALVVGDKVYSLAGAETPYRLLVEAMGEGAAILDEAGAVLYANRRLAEMLDAPAGGLVGEPLRRFVAADDRPALDRLLAPWPASGPRMEATLLRAGGGEGPPVQLSAGWLEAPGALARWMVAADLTERRAALEATRRMNTELEDRVRERTAALEAANQELEAFVYSVSHDLRAPLRAIDGFSRIVIEECADRLDEEGRDNLARVREASTRMSRLIDDLLRLSRLTRGELRRERVDLGAVAREVMAELRARDPLRRVDFEVGDDLVANADPGLMRAVLDNLLGNAWKFTGRRALARISLGRERREGERAYVVRDNGVGFDMTQAARLFGPFQRLHTEQDFPGVGVGLASVKRIVNRHGGRVWAESAPGQGAAFFFTLAGGGA